MNVEQKTFETKNSEESISPDIVGSDIPVVVPISKTTEPTTGSEPSLRQLSAHMHRLEMLISGQATEKAPAPFLLELLKLVFGGWPVFGFVFLALFYIPFRQILETFPEKMRHAEEINLGGVSLKSSFKKEAIAQGLLDLTYIIPNLSNSAIETFLKASSGQNIPVVFFTGEDGTVNKLHFPSRMQVEALAELDKAGLIVLEGEVRSGSQILPHIKTMISRYRAKPVSPNGLERDGSEDQVLNDVFRDQVAVIDPPLMFMDMLAPKVTCKLSPKGIQAKDIILRAISTQLRSTAK